MAKITSLAELTDVASDDLLVVVDKSDTSMADSGTDKKVQKVNLLKGLVPENGWIPAGETWTYASATSFKISGDKTGKYQTEDKLRLTQTTAKYFRITDISYSSPNTTVTVDGFGIYTLANATITSPYYSKMDNPQGFPRKEVLLFSGTPAASITLSETSDHFDRLIICLNQNERLFTYIAELSGGTPSYTMNIQGYLDDAYRIRIGGGTITISGTTVAVGASGSNYSTDTKSDSTVVFSDTKIAPTITKVIGIRW